MAPPFDPLAYRDPCPSRAIIRALGPVNRRLILPGLLRVRAIDFPAPEVARLRAAVNPGTAAFLGPNHPEFMTDWMLDKEISRRVSPLMAHWASYEVVNIHPVAQWLWLRNNLIANAPGGRGREYSIDWALEGHGVLLHPEGTPTWHGDEIGPLVPGIVQMAWETCRWLADAARAVPVHLVPVVWKLAFERDAARELVREIDCVERRLGLPRGTGAAVETRFGGLQGAVLARSRAKFGLPATPPVSAGEFFDAQAAFAARLLAGLEVRHGSTAGEFSRRAHALRRAILASSARGEDEARADRKKLAEVERLHRFTRERYSGTTLTQEQIAESVKQLRITLLTRGLRDGMHGVVPVAAASRVAHVRVPEPIVVDEAFARGGDEAAAQAGLLVLLRDRLQRALDAVNTEIAPWVDPWRRPNPFAAGRAGAG